jgi:4-hydroxy-tetrahydrodipicolinate reductase
MTNIIISGCNGHMGRVVAEICAADPQVNDDICHL